MAIIALSPSALAVSPSMAGVRTTADGSMVQGIRWHRNFDAGWREAARRNVPMVIFISARRCHYCEVMKASTWADPCVTNEVNQDYVAISLNPDDNAAVLSRIDVEMYPMTLVGLPEGRIIDSLKGFQPVKEILRLVQKHRR